MSIGSIAAMLLFSVVTGVADVLTPVASGLDLALIPEHLVHV